MQAPFGNRTRRLPVSLYLNCKTKLASALAIGTLCSSVHAQQPATTNPTPPLNAQAEVAGQTKKLTEDQRHDLGVWLAVLRGSAVDPQIRRDTVVSLLNREWPQAITELEIDLIGEGNNATKQAIAQAVALRVSPPNSFIEPFIRLLDTEDEALNADVASALAAYDSDEVLERLASIVNDSQRSLRQRQGAIQALAQQRIRIPEVVNVLLNQTDDADPSIRNAALEGLVDLTGITEFKGNILLWRQWWQKHKSLPAEQWAARLLKRHATQTDALRNQLTLMTKQLEETFNRLYVLTPEADRSLLLNQMLNNELAAVRLLSLTLIERVLLNAQSVSEGVQETMRKHLTDPNSEVRTTVALRLRDLNDMQAADLVLPLLAREPNPEVQQAFLSLMTLAPSPEAVSTALMFLSNPTVRSNAAAFLTAAADSSLLSDLQSIQALKVARASLQSETSPDTNVLRLLGRIGTESDRQMIVQLIASEQSQVRHAAAEIAMRFDPVPLETLLTLLADPGLAPLAISAATLHGKDQATIRQLLEHTPNDPDLRQKWQLAIVSIAQRVSYTSLMEIDNTIAARTEWNSLRESILTTVEARSNQPIEGANAAIEVNARFELLLRHCELIASTNRSRQAQALFESVLGKAGVGSNEQRTRLYLGLLAVHVANNTIEDDAHAIKLAKFVLTDATPTIRDTVFATLLTAVDQALDTNERNRAKNLIDEIQLLGLTGVGASVLDRLNATIKRLETPSSRVPTPSAPESQPTPGSRLPSNT